MPVETGQTNGLWMRKAVMVVFLFSFPFSWIARASGLQGISLGFFVPGFFSLGWFGLLRLYLSQHIWRKRIYSDNYFLSFVMEVVDGWMDCDTWN